MKSFLTILLVYCASAFTSPAADETIKVLCTTFPVFEITRNVTKDSKALTVELLLSASLGCPHHYSLTPADMQKLTDADVVVINGSGFEDFLSTALTKTAPDKTVINASSGIENLIKVVSTDHDHSHASVNPHLFTSPAMRAKMAAVIANQLAKLSPAEAQLYEAAAKQYADRMQSLSKELSELGKHLANNRIVQPHGVFDYMARDAGLEIAATLQEEGRSPSAAEMLALIKVIRNNKAGAIFSEPQYPSKIAETIAKETALPTAELDPAASGPDDAPLDYFEKVMRRNMETIRATLGTKE